MTYIQLLIAEGIARRDGDLERASALRAQRWSFAMGLIVNDENTRCKTELTPIGEQYVIPGCERHERPQGAQLKLWER